MLVALPSMFRLTSAVQLTNIGLCHYLVSDVM